MILAGVASLLLDRKKAEKTCLGALTMTAALSALLFVFLWRTKTSFSFPMGYYPAPWGNELQAGPFEALMALTFTVVMILSLLAGRERISADIAPSRQSLYYLFCCMLISSLLSLIYTNDIFTAYVFVEINTLAACAIVAVKDSRETIAATIRYLIMSLLASGLILIAVTLLYAITGHLLMHDLLSSMTQLAASGEYVFPCMVIMLLFSIGLAVKSALFPFHTWLPSAHASATAASSAILSGIVLKGYIILLLKIYYRVFGLSFAQDLRAAELLFVFGLLGMIAGSLVAVRERNLKSVLAYSSVSQVGYIFMGIGLSTDIGMVAACFHIMAHAVTKPLLFLSADGLMDVSGNKKDIRALQGAGRRNFLAGLAFSLGALSMIGIPLFSGFVSKFYFVQGSFQTPYKMLPTLTFMVLSTVLTAMYYLPVMITIYIDSDEESPYRNERSKNTWVYSAAIVAFILLNFALGIFYEPVIQALEQGLSMF
jgi:multicomponent Na+:H+ antiporter subunit D